MRVTFQDRLGAAMLSGVGVGDQGAGLGIGLPGLLLETMVPVGVAG